METDHSRRGSQKGSWRGIRDTVKEDIRRGNFQSSLLRDLRTLYHFYLDEETRSTLREMNRVRRWIHVIGWLLHNLIHKLSPARRLLLLLSIVLIIYSIIARQHGNTPSGDIYILASFVLVLLVLMFELMEKLVAQDELAVGRAVQLALLPDRNPQFAGWDAWLFTQPANEVGGDLVDYMSVGEKRLGLMLGDVSGKGLGAALLMARLQATLRALAPDVDTLGDLGVRTNAILCRDGLMGKFATLVYIELAADSGTVRILNAGHPPPLVLRSGGHEELVPVSLPLGVKQTAEYQEQIIVLQPGEMLLIFSDGLTEAGNAQDEFFGEERLIRMLPELLPLAPDKVGAHLLRTVKRFVGEARSADDLSLIVLKKQ